MESRLTVGICHSPKRRAGSQVRRARSLGPGCFFLDLAGRVPVCVSLGGPGGNPRKQALASGGAPSGTPAEISGSRRRVAGGGRNLADAARWFPWAPGGFRGGPGARGDFWGPPEASGESRRGAKDGGGEGDVGKVDGNRPDHDQEATRRHREGRMGSYGAIGGRGGMRKSGGGGNAV